MSPRDIPQLRSFFLLFLLTLLSLKKDIVVVKKYTGVVGEMTVLSLLS